MRCNTCKWEEMRHVQAGATALVHETVLGMDIYKMQTISEINWCGKCGKLYFDGMWYEPTGKRKRKKDTRPVQNPAVIIARGMDMEEAMKLATAELEADSG